MYKEQILKANHNYPHSLLLLFVLLSNVQRTNFESKSQLVVVPIFLASRCYQMYKEQILKANHN